MKRITEFLTHICEEYLPDAFVFSLILTLVVYTAGLIFTPSGPLQLIEYWGKDFWSLNAFAMQMIFVLVTGNILATTPMVKKIMLKLTSLVQNETHALLLVSIFSIFTCWINWGFGLIASAVLAIELAKKLRKTNFGLLVATAYSGFLVWHGGFSGSIPLKIAGKDEILGKIYPGLSIPLSETIFSLQNLIICFCLLVILPATALLLRDGKTHEIKPSEEVVLPIGVNSNIREKVENSRWLNVIFFIFFLVATFQVFNNGGAFDINQVNFIFLFLAIFLHGTPRNFLKALESSFANASGIAIQFPFYAGIMGIMQYSGLADLTSELFVSISNSVTLPFFAFISGGIVNFFVPSGGGQWAIQGPLMLKAAKELSVEPSRVAMAVAWGDAWTNMIQPFWALPLLGLAKLKLKDIMGYCLIYLIASGVVISLALLIF